MDAKQNIRDQVLNPTCHEAKHTAAATRRFRNRMGINTCVGFADAERQHLSGRGCKLVELSLTTFCGLPVHMHSITSMINTCTSRGHLKYAQEQETQNVKEESDVGNDIRRDAYFQLHHVQAKTE